MSTEKGTNGEQVVAAKTYGSMIANPGPAYAFPLSFHFFFEI